VVVDHYDSYTWNLVRLVAEETGAMPEVVQHDRTTAAHVLAFDRVVLSPGPGHPELSGDFGVGRDVVLAGTVPVLGVCLGMQGLVTAFGGRVARGRPAHGETCAVTHDGLGVFRGLPDGFRAVRYHSLVVTEVPPDLTVTATSDGVIVGVRHRTLPLEGVQFHPESVLTEHGAALIANFLAGPAGAP
jgi:anthranilate synthase component 2/para-aminobenzoate synthetase